MQFAVSAAIITACTMTSIFQYSDKSVVFMYFFVFGLSAIMLSFLITTFFSRAKTAVAVGTLSFVGAYFPYYTVIDVAVPMYAIRISSILIICHLAFHSLKMSALNVI
jgi:ATP-binding cassette subfamily A (ABC1) protein 3